MINLAVIMDPIERIKTYKDSTFAMLLAAEQRNWPIYYIKQGDLFFENDQVYARWQKIHVKDDENQWFEVVEEGCDILSELVDVILMRKDPPFDMEYVYTTYLLEIAEKNGVLVVNKPQSLRDANEKLFTTYFPQCCPPTLVSRSMDDIRGFIDKHQDVIVKPLDMMGGASIFRLQPGDQNLSVVLEMARSKDCQSLTGSVLKSVISISLRDLTCSSDVSLLSHWRGLPISSSWVFESSSCNLVSWNL